MNSTQSAFLGLLASALSGEKAAIPEDVEFTALCGLAQMHGASALLHYGVKRSGLPQNEQLRRSALLGISRQTMMHHELGRFLEACRSAGLPAVVLKGLAIAMLYPAPELRSSGDADILINIEDLPKISEILSKLGGEIDSNLSEADCVHANLNALHLELHTRIAAQGFPQAELLRGESTVQLEACGLRFTAPEPTAHMVYLICHLAEHMAGTGFGIRQLMDIAIFASHYYDELDWDAFNKQMRHASLEGFSAVLFSLSVRYFGADKRLLQGDSEPNERIADSLLEDILTGGLYGRATAERAASYSLSKRAAEGRKASVWRSLFPSGESLMRRYPFARRRKLLLPLAWLKRLTEFLKSSSASPLEMAGKTVEISRSRVQLMRGMGMLGGTRAKLLRLERLMPMIMAALEEGTQAKLPIFGGSMQPFLKSGRDYVLLEKPATPLKKGDVVLYHRENGAYILHRILQIDKKNMLYICGDAQGFLEGPIKPKQIIARAVSFEIKGKSHGLKHPKCLFYAGFWRWCYPFRWLAAKAGANKKIKG
ncbi:MAG: nucleotidyltransferase family protein [Oscillospiraceae bacterium]|nr:nucleotidyltransferase family protein [Oscillospiraceae bacterium]